MFQKALFIKNEEGSAIVIAVMILMVVTIIGVSSTNTTTVELQIVRNDGIYKENLYLAEAAAQEGIQRISNLSRINISDEPMETQVQSAAANIMFILDNSGSMDWEFLTDGIDGKFEGNIEYLFDDPGDNTYGTGSSNGTILTGAGRAKWKSQWSGYNKVYCDPSSDYLPWPQTTNNPHADADVSNPRSNPANATPTFDLTAEYDSVAGYDGEVIVDNTDAGFSVSDESHWGTSNYANNIGSNYRYNEILPDPDPAAWAQWTPTLPAAGNYEVYVWFKSLDTRSKTVNLHHRARQRHNHPRPHQPSYG